MSAKLKRMPLRILLLFLGLIFLNFKQASASNCTYSDQQQITGCARPLFDIGAIKSDQWDAITWEVFTQISKEYFQEICSAFYRFDACAEPYKAQCFNEEPMRSKYKTIAEILQFICGDGYHGMVDNYDCFITALSRREMFDCHQEMMKDADVIRANDFGVKTGVGYEVPDYKQRRTCYMMQNYLTCIQSPIKQQCGYGAWHIVREVVRRPAEIALPQCTLTAASIYPSLFVIIVSNLFFVAL